MKKYRVIYMMESVDNDGRLIYRLFAANKKAVDRIVKQHKGVPKPSIRKLSSREKDWVNSADVEI